MWTELTSAGFAIVATVVTARAATERARTTVTVAAAAVSGVVTAVVAAGRAPGWTPPGWDASLLPFLAELAALTTLTVRVAHRGRPVAAALGAGATGLAVALLVLRLISPSSWPAALGACALWAGGAAGAAAVGLHLRRQDRRRERHAEEARRSQRLRLARDLHDFVAHDVSEMVAGAQAGLVVGHDPARAAALFRGIEQAGQHALATLDRTVQMLDDPAAPPRSGLADVPGLTARFSAVGPGRAVLELDPALAATIPAAVSAVAFRIVAEALTNVRRHAPTAALVHVAVTRTGRDTLTVTVANDLPGTPGPSREAPAGHGLPGLAAAVAAVGGRLDAGPHGADWRLRAELPLSRS